jgi:5-methylcytosine-specific restriction endonuclease McrA
MNRRVPLARRTALAPPAEPMPRSPLRSLGARSRREAEALADFRLAVIGRARGACERCGATGRKLHAHHVRPRSLGGKHEAGNGFALCYPCHRGAHEHREDWRSWIDDSRVREHATETVHPERPRAQEATTCEQ